MNCNRLNECEASLVTNKSQLSSCKNERCLQSYDTRSAVKAEENRKKYVLHNNGSMIVHYKVDKGMIDSEKEEKCDDLIMIPQAKQAVFVELKGTDLRHAFSQIYSTVLKLGPQMEGYALHGRIISSNRTNVPCMKTEPRYVTLSKEIRRHQGTLICSTNQYEEKLDDLKRI